MKSKRFWLLATMTAVMFGLPSCSSDSETKENNNSPAELKICASMTPSLEVSTRANYDLQSTIPVDFSDIGIYVWYTGYTAAKASSPAYAGYTDKVASYTGTGPYTLTPTTNTTMYFPVDNADVDVYLYAPYKSPITQTNMCVEHTVALDQSLTAGYLDSDYIYGKATATYATKTASVTMYHAMSKIIFKVVDQGVDPAQLQNITLQQVYKTTTINMPQAIPGGGMTCGGAATDNVAVATDLDNIIVWGSTGTGAVSASDAVTFGAAVIIPPQTTHANAKVSVVVDGSTSTANFNGITLAPGKVYTYNLRLIGQSLSIQLVSITDWQSGGAAQNLDFDTWSQYCTKVILRSLQILLAAILLISCSQEEGKVQEIGDIVYLQMATDTCESTRANDGVNNNSTFIYPSNFTVAADGENYVYTALSANSNMTSAAPAHFPINGNSVRIQAFYPSISMQYSNTPQTFTVEHDQSQTSIGTTGYRVSDLMYGLPRKDFADIDPLTSGATRKVNPTINAIPLVFEHKMVKIRVDITLSGVSVKRITMKNVKRSIDFNPVDTTFSNLATAADGLGDEVIMYDNATGTTTDIICTALIPKQNLAINTAFVDILIEDYPSDKTMTYKLHEKACFSPGLQYVYNMSVSMDELEVSCEIANWNSAPADPEFTQIKNL